MADTTIKLSGTYDSIEANNILEEMKQITPEINGKIATNTAKIATLETGKVSKSGDTMSGRLKSGQGFTIQNLSVDKTTIPSATSSKAFEFTDKNGQMINAIYGQARGNGTNDTVIRTFALNNINRYADIYLSIDKDGNPSAEAPTPATTDNSNQIATTAYVRNSSVNKAGDTMSGDLSVSKNSEARINAKNTSSNCGVSLVAENTGSRGLYDNVNNSWIIYANAGTNNIYLPASPATTDNSDKIATTAFVNNFLKGETKNNTNFNTITKTGYYTIGATSKNTYNAPTDSYGCLCVFNGGTYILQIYVATSIMWFRMSINSGSSWNSWYKVTSTVNS